MSVMAEDIGTPLGLKLVKQLGWAGKETAFKNWALVFTFIIYMMFHMNRKVISVVQTVLGGPANATLPADGGWAPFNGPNGASLLGGLDSAFLFSYATCQFVSGQVADRVNLRYFLSAGTFASALFGALFGLGYFLNIHAFGYYAAMQVFAGIAQSTGWPSVVAVVGNYLGKGNRGLVMGIWNSMTSVGNITGGLLASAGLSISWGWSFLIPAILMAFVGVLVFYFMAPHPHNVGLSSPYDSTLDISTVLKGPVGNDDPATTNSSDNNSISHDESEALIEHELDPNADPNTMRNTSNYAHHKGVSFLQVLRIRGLIEFALCLFFSKLVSYAFLYWLPTYLARVRIGGSFLSPSQSGNVATFFDVGGIFGSIAAGMISDRTKQGRAIVAASFLLTAIPILVMYRLLGDSSLPLNIGLMILSGAIVNGPYALITTAVSVDLGTHKCLKGDARALSTVTAVIDGTGSFGAAFGPLLVGMISSHGTGMAPWDHVFIMLCCSSLIAALLLTRLVVREVRQMAHERRKKRSRQLTATA